MFLFRPNPKICMRFTFIRLIFPNFSHLLPQTRLFKSRLFDHQYHHGPLWFGGIDSRLEVRLASGIQIRLITPTPQDK